MERKIDRKFWEKPLICPRCRCEMELWAIWHPRYGTIYDVTVELKKRASVESEEKERRPDIAGRCAISEGTGGQKSSQLSLSDMWV